MATVLRGIDEDLRTVTSYSPFLLARCTTDFRYRFVNDAYAQMLGLRSSQIIGKSIIEIIGENAFKTILPYVQRVLQGCSEEYESKIDFKSVGTRSLHVIYTPERDNCRDVSGWVESIIDVSDRIVGSRLSEIYGICNDPVENDPAPQ